MVVAAMAVEPDLFHPAVPIDTVDAVVVMVTTVDTHTRLDASYSQLTVAMAVVVVEVLLVDLHLPLDTTILLVELTMVLPPCLPHLPHQLPQQFQLCLCRPWVLHHLVVLHHLLHHLQAHLFHHPHHQEVLLLQAFLLLSLVLLLVLAAEAVAVVVAPQQVWHSMPVFQSGLTMMLNPALMLFQLAGML